MAYKNTQKIKKVCLRTYYIAGHLKPRGPHAARGLGSLAVHTCSWSKTGSALV